MWTRKAQVVSHHLQRDPGGSFEISASHDGYRRLKSAFAHKREVNFDPKLGVLEVRDNLQGQASECLELFWHFHPSWATQLNGDSVRLTCGERSLELSVTAVGMSGASKLELLSGQVAPPLAWYSESYNVKQASTTLRWRGHGEKVSLLTRLSF